ncbi:MAG: GNAT family N-acetyltransferase [Treponema sp.]|jgi:predicted acetyltransferase|nr:GNAT family N-acetyltransferase [Treponema sp.]
MTEIRRLSPEELPQLYKMHTVVYNMRRNFAEKEKEEDKALEHPAQWCWGAFEKGKLLAGMFEIEFLMRFDGNNAKMSGIGGVGTLPESRKGGLIRRIFERLLPQAYEQGVIFSNLTPFSHDFYRLFGYEIACARNRITIPSKEFHKLKPGGEFVQIFPGDDTAALQQVHSAYIRDLNHGICRDYWPDNRAWRRFTRDDPYTTGTFLFLWKDGQGAPRSYIKYQDKEGGEGHFMHVTDLAFVDREGLYGALGIVGGLSAQFRQFQWLMPTFIDPCDFTGGAWEIEQNIIPRDMTRVVNVKAALELMRLPAGEGSYVIEAEDSNIAANNGKYLVEFSSGKAKVSLTNKTPDLRCGIHVLSQLITGYRALENALLSRQTGIELCGNKETLERVFTLRPQHVTEYF